MQRSFSYYYTLQTDLVSVEANGSCVIGRGEHIRGVWQHVDTTTEFEYVGLGDIEYVKKDREYEISSRGEESDVFVQIKRILEFDEFEYELYDNGFWYRFKPNVPFLIPKRWKDMTGILKISAHNFLPELIWAGLPDSSSYWQAKLYKYNHKREIKPPVKEYHRYLIVNEDALNIDRLLKSIKKRLKLINLDYKVKKEAGSIYLSTPVYHSLEDVKKMLAPGVTNIYGLAPDKKGAKRVEYLNNDFNSPIYLSDRILSSQDIRDAHIKFDQTSRPYILVSLEKKYRLPHEVAFEIDGSIIATAVLDTSLKIDKITMYPNMQYLDIEIIRSCLIQPIPKLQLRQVSEGIH